MYAINMEHRQMTVVGQRKPGRLAPDRHVTVFGIMLETTSEPPRFKLARFFYAHCPCHFQRLARSYLRRSHPAATTRRPGPQSGASHMERSQLSLARL